MPARFCNVVEDSIMIDLKTAVETGRYDEWLEEALEFDRLARQSRAEWEAKFGDAEYRTKKT